LEYLERVGLSDKEKVRLDKLSGGQQQKIQLGVTIMNDPELLILDEPTKGFDPINRRLVMDVIDDSRKAGATVLMVTHQMEEVERLCDRVILLKDGTSRAYGTVEEVQEQFGGTVIHVDHAGAIPPSDRYRIASDIQGHAELEVSNNADFADILRELVDGGVEVRQFTPTRKSLDDIFVEVYGAETEAEV
jgi:ABC-2 type transport system ATP-binding protein